MHPPEDRGGFWSTVSPRRPSGVSRNSVTGPAIRLSLPTVPTAPTLVQHALKNGRTTHHTDLTGDWRRSVTRRVGHPQPGSRANHPPGAPPTDTASRRPDGDYSAPGGRPCQLSHKALPSWSPGGGAARAARPTERGSAGIGRDAGMSLKSRSFRAEEDQKRSQ